MSPAGKAADDVAFTEPGSPEAMRAEDEDTARLVALAQKGDRDSFAVLYTRFFDRVYSYMRALLHDRHEAEDAASEVWLKVMEALPRYQRRKQPFRAWLFVVVRNTGLDRIAAKARVEPVDPAELDMRREGAAPKSAIEARFSALHWIKDPALTVFVDRLPKAQRQVLALRFLFDLRPAEIARLMGRTRTDVSTLQYRAMRFLEERLDAVNNGPTSKSSGAGEGKGKGKGGNDRAPIRRWGTPANVTRSRRFALQDKRQDQRRR